MILTQSANDILIPIEASGRDWSTACMYCVGKSIMAADDGDSEGVIVWRDRAFEIDNYCKSRNRREKLETRGYDT